MAFGGRQAVHPTDAIIRTAVTCFGVGSFATSDGTCANCRNGFPSNCLTASS
ncbi:hypothetical protein [Actinomadura chokoriensis]|uniref:hypothetical protein n=1 Tax=Actinomadura chokoriensis TaxID=454156 RepID=UPI0031F7C9B9